MPRIFDNIEKHLLTGLSEAMGLSERADFCVGYFNLRGWRQVDAFVEKWTGGDGHCCRLLVGMQRMPQDQLRSAMGLLKTEDEIDQATAMALKRRLAQDFREQLMVGLPTNEDEAGLQPFHWFVEFYGIMNRGGFDVVIGNPPWREYAAVKGEYTLQGYCVKKSGNLYALCTERSLQLVMSGGYFSFIVQLPLVSSSRMVTLREYLIKHCCALNVIPCDDRPGKLFDGLQNCRATIFIARKDRQTSRHDFSTTRYNRWATEVRDSLFLNLSFTKIEESDLSQNQFPKIPSVLAGSAFSKLFAGERTSVQRILSPRKTEYFIFYQEATRYWVKVTVGLPYYAKNGKIGAPAHGRYLFFNSEKTTHIVCAVLNSSVFYTYFIAYGDCFHLSDTLATSVPLAQTVLTDKTVNRLSIELMKDLKRNASKKTINTKNGDKIAYDEFNVSRSKPIIDQIDQVLAKHYGFTDEELDFIINYDIKYRMGRDAGNGGRNERPCCQAS